MSVDIVTDGSCGLSWDDDVITSMTPAPAGRCPFEYFHRYDANDEALPLDKPEIPFDFEVQPV